MLAYCAIDAFTHLFEAYLSKTAGAMTRDMSLSGIRHFLAAWPALNRSDAAREAIMQASYLGADAERRRAGVIHGIAGDRRAARLPPRPGLRPPAAAVPALLESSEQPQQRALMAELAARLYLHWQGSPESYLTDFITRHAIAPFWQNDLPISRQELAVALEKSNSKNSWIDYAPAQRQRMIEEAFRVE